MKGVANGLSENLGLRKILAELLEACIAFFLSDSLHLIISIFSPTPSQSLNRFVKLSLCLDFLEGYKINVKVLMCLGDIMITRYYKCK